MQKARLDTLQQKIRPNIPLYVTIFNQTSQTDGSLVICKDYAVPHLSHKDQTITLCHPSNSKTWYADSKTSTDGTYTLTACWSGFVRDNKLQEGDICVFEVSKSQRRDTMTVHLLKEAIIHQMPLNPRKVICMEILGLDIWSHKKLIYMVDS